MERYGSLEVCVAFKEVHVGEVPKMTPCFLWQFAQGRRLRQRIDSLSL